MEQPFIDYSAISSEISKKCHQYLHDVDVNTVLDSFNAVKEILEIAIERYSFQVRDYWKQNHSDVEISRKIKFMDIDNGYVNLLTKWVRENPFRQELPDCPNDFVESYGKYNAKVNKTAVAAGTAGTLAIGAAYGVSTSQAAAGAKGCLAFGNPLVAIIAELIGIAAIYALAQYQKKNKRKEIDAQRREYKAQLKEYKQKFINTLTASAEIYLKEAEAYSNNILTEF